jgi:hypothetical protein
MNAKKVTFGEKFRMGCIRVYVYLLDRMSEPSTLRGIVMALTSIGVWASPKNLEAILTIGMLVVGLLGALLPDRIRRQAEASKKEE